MDFLPPACPDSRAYGASPSEGEIEGLAGWEDLERESERAYLGTVMLRKPTDRTAAGIRLEASHFHSTLRGRMLEAIRSLYPWEDSALMEQTLAYALSRQYGLKNAQLEIGWCLGHAEPWGEVDAVAARVLQGWKRRQRVRILDELRACCHDSEAMKQGCERLLALD